MPGGSKQQSGCKGVPLRRSAKFPTEKAVGPREYDKGHLSRREQGSENGAQKPLLGDVYGGARELKC